MSSPKISRNDPCPCGSGKKYKQCCQGRDSAQASGAAATQREIDLIPERLKSAHKHRQAREYAQAEVLCEQILAVQPKHVKALHELALTLLDSGQPKRAEEALARAVRLEPSVPLYYDLARAQSAQGDPARAADSFRQALALNPGSYGVWGDLGNAELQLHHPEQAIDCYRRALALNVKSAACNSNLGAALHVMAQHAEARDCFRRALALQPDFLLAHSNLLFSLSADEHTTPAEYLAEARRYGEKVLALARPFRQWRTAPVGAGAPLRVGLVSGDLREHPVGYFVAGLLANLDKSRVQMHAYSTHRGEDAMTARLKPDFACWRTLAGLGDEEAAQLIHADGVHVLIDLSGHSANNRLPLFAWKPAPVQLSWLAYLASTGVPGMDYFLADPVTVPEDAPEQFTEQVWRLPDSVNCFTPPAESLAIPPLPALANGHVTFGSFQNLSKVNDASLALWGRLLARLPDARLRVHGRQLSHEGERAYLEARLAKAGVPAGRVELVGSVASRADHLANYARVDISLDTFPYPGITTTCEALWMGTPVLTLAGQTLLTRQGASLLGCVGLHDWVAQDAEDYLARAQAHAADLDRLATLRAGLRDRLLASPLTDAPRFARHMTDAWYGMWERHGAGSA